MAQNPVQNPAQQAVAQSNSIRQVNSAIENLQNKLNTLDKDRKLVDVSYKTMIDQMGKYETIRADLTSAIRVYARGIEEKEIGMDERQKELKRTDESLKTLNQTSKKNLDDLQLKIKKLADALSAVEQQHSQLMKAISDNTAQLNTLRATNQSLSTEHAELNASRSELKGTASGLAAVGAKYNTDISAQRNSFEQLIVSMSSLQTAIGQLDSEILPSYMKNYMNFPLLAQLRVLFLTEVSSKKPGASQSLAGWGVSFVRENRRLDDNLVREFLPMLTKSLDEMNQVGVFLKSNLGKPAFASSSEDWSSWIKDLKALNDLLNGSAPTNISWSLFYTGYWLQESMNLPSQYWSGRIGDALKKAKGIS